MQQWNDWHLLLVTSVSPEGISSPFTAFDGSLSGGVVVQLGWALEYIQINEKPKIRPIASAIFK